ncbi:MAG: peptidoglycan-binding protein [Candidatus Fimadaptatus sp.]
MKRRLICLLLVMAMTLTCFGTAFADSDDGIADHESITRPTDGIDEEPSPTPIAPTATPTSAPTNAPTDEPTQKPTDEPVQPTDAPSAEPSAEPSATPTVAPSLSIGSRGEDVRNLQTQLKILGFSSESADGVFGERTEDAVSRLQTYLALLNAHGIVDYYLEEVGTADSALLTLLANDGVPRYYQTMKSGSSGSQVSRLQRRLASLEYLLDSEVDGEFGSSTLYAIKDFQKTNGLEVSGTADRATQEKLFSSSAKKCTDPNARYPYKLIIDVSEQRVYVYKNEGGSYSKLVDKFICSTGKRETPTPLGTYRSTERINRWHYFRAYDCWAQYAYRIVGSYYFHSVIYNQKGGSPTSSSVRNLGRRASHGCVRLKVEDAKWIYNNCPAGTTVVVRN